MRAAPGGPSQPSPTGKGDSRSGGEAFPLTFPYGEGGSPQARRMRGAAEVTGWKYVRSKAPPEGKLFVPQSLFDKTEQMCYTVVEK